MRHRALLLGLGMFALLPLRLHGPQRADYKNAAQFCKALRTFLGDEAFRNRYGGGANAQGKCVSGGRR